MGQPFTMMTGINYPLPAKCLYLKVFMNSYHNNTNDTVIIIDVELDQIYCCLAWNTCYKYNSHYNITQWKGSNLILEALHLHTLHEWQSITTDLDIISWSYFNAYARYIENSSTWHPSMSMNEISCNMPSCTSAIIHVIKTKVKACLL